MTAESIGKSASGVSAARQFVVLAKPRIALMVLLTVAVSGFVSAQDLLGDSPQSLSLWKLVNAVIGLLLVSASGCALNQYLERYVDWLMPRTAHRPLPDEKLTATQVAAFGAVTFGAGVSYLWTLVNWQSAALATISWVIYVWIYTPLKARSWLNTYVGAVAGALPVLVGSTAIAEGTITVNAWWLFAVLYVWQFPHFMAIAWLYREDYRAANIRMITVDDPQGRATGRHAVVFATILLPITWVAMWPTSWSALVFLALAVGLGGWYWFASWQFARNPGDARAKQLFRVSLVYLPGYLINLTIALWLSKGPN